MDIERKDLYIDKNMTRYTLPINSDEEAPATMQICYDACKAAFDFVKSEELLSDPESLPAKIEVIN